MERLRSENEAFRQSAGTQAVIERNAKIQDLEQRNQELRVQLTEVRKKLVDVEAGKEDIQRTLNQVRLNLHNLEGEVEQLKTENQALRQQLEEIDFPRLDTKEAVLEYIAGRRYQHASEALGRILDRKAVDQVLDEAIALPILEEVALNSNAKVAEGVDTKIEKSDEAIASPTPEKIKCGEDSRCENPHFNKHGTPGGKQRWRCTNCRGTFTKEMDETP